MISIPPPPSANPGLSLRSLRFCTILFARHKQLRRESSGRYAKTFCSRDRSLGARRTSAGSEARTGGVCGGAEREAGERAPALELSSPPPPPEAAPGREGTAPGLRGAAGRCGRRERSPGGARRECSEWKRGQGVGRCGHSPAGACVRAHLRRREGNKGGGRGRVARKLRASQP